MENHPQNTSFASSRCKYHVFLSFRGEDTRLGFTSHLYAALERKGFITFQDNLQLERGDVITQELHKAIEESLVAIVIISENYASSTWCLDELQKILESKRVLGKEVLPIFYGVCPSDVRHQKNSFAEAFEKHAIKFEDKEKVQKWRDSLKEVAGISGWESKHKLEAELIEDVVEKVWTKLHPKLPSYIDGVVGVYSKVKEMDSLLSEGSEDVYFIGIWGMGGIGKTTLARVIFNRIHTQFEIFCFLSNIREVSKTYGLVHLQNKLLSTLRIRKLEIDDSHDGKKKIKNLMCNKKVLLILDDISCSSQLENLAENQKWFGPGSRVIITTRDMHLLVSHGISRKYEMKVLDARCSIQLFSQKAFKREQPPKHYLELTRSVVQYVGGLPLAIEVLGSFLCGRPLHEWEEVLAKQVTPNKILNTLRISYDGLEYAQRAMFLDIAFFFNGQEKDRVIQIMKDCGFYPTIEISILTEKSLVTCHEGILEMHDLLQEMGRSVVFQESPNDASRRSRLCSLEDINQVLRKNKGMKFIEGIILKSSDPYEVDWDPEAFSKMYSLRVLIILCDLHLPLGLKCLSSSLKILEWKGYPLKGLPLGLPLDELIHIKMHHSKLQRLWNGIQYFRKLKSIDLSHSRDLIETPNISGVPSLERLVLKGCKNLVKVHQSVAQHNNLTILNLKDCFNLKSLPKKLEMNALEEFILSGCSQLKKLPEFGESMKRLYKLRLRDCKSLVCLPQSIRNLKSLEKINIDGCSQFFSLPNNSNEKNAPKELDVSETTTKEVPSSTSDWLINKVFGLGKYIFSADLKSPPLSSLSSLKILKLSYCNLSDGSVPDDIGNLSSLEQLYLAGNNFVNLADSIANLPRLSRLDLYDCPMLQTLPVLPPTVHQLFVQNCTQIAPISFDPQRIWKTFELNRWNLENPFWFIIPGSEIPPWFDNQDYFLLDPHLLDFDYDEEYAVFASTIVDTPDYCRSSDWMGIVLCLSLESTMKPHKHHQNPISIRWALKAPETEMVYPLCFHRRQGTHFSGCHLLITGFQRDCVRCKRNLMGDQNKVQLIFYAENHAKCGKLKLRNCGSRVICKEEKVWHRGEAESEVKIHSIFVDSGVLKQSRITEITDELEDEVTAFDAADQISIHDK